MLHERPQLDLQVEREVDLRGGDRGRQRVTAQLEEVLLRFHPLDLQRAAPDLREQLLGLG
jgi:hypothetical protein